MPRLAGQPIRSGIGVLDESSLHTSPGPVNLSAGRRLDSRMYLSHFGLSEPPFRITPHTDFFFEGANRGATLEALLYAVLHDEGIVKVSGEVGSGKTMLCRVLLERLPRNVDTIYLATPSLNRDEILRAIAEDLQIDVQGKRTTVLLRALQQHLIQRYAEGHRVVVLIDEAHAMPAGTLEEIRLLSNLESNRHKLLQIVLFGQPELDGHLRAPNMRQLKERITHGFRLEPLVRQDIESYIDFRMRAAGYKGRNAFSPGALRVIASASEGLTRRINVLADKSLLAAFADSSHEVTARHARAAVKDCGYGRLSAPRFGRTGLALAGLVAGVILALGIQWFLSGNGASRNASDTSSTAGGGASQASRPPAAAGEPAPADLASSPRPPANANGLPPGGRPQDAPGAPATQVGSAGQAAGAPPSVADDAKVRAPAPGRMVRDRFIAGQRWLAATPSEHYSIQLLTASESDLPWMENFLLRATDLVGPDQLYVYSWKLNGKLNYRVSFGTFLSQQEAVAALALVPAPLKAYKPYPESVGTIRRLSSAG